MTQASAPGFKTNPDYRIVFSSSARRSSSVVARSGGRADRLSRYRWSDGAPSTFDPSDEDAGIAAPIRSMTLASTKVLEDGVVWLR
jgi:hypothetical protein